MARPLCSTRASASPSEASSAGSSSATRVIASGSGGTVNSSVAASQRSTPYWPSTTIDSRPRPPGNRPSRTAVSRRPAGDHDDRADHRTELRPSAAPPRDRRRRCSGSSMIGASVPSKSIPIMVSRGPRHDRLHGRDTRVGNRSGWAHRSEPSRWPVDAENIGYPARRMRRRGRIRLGSATYAVGRHDVMSPDRRRGRTRRATSGRLATASFVVVANRLPVDRVENPDGSVDWRTSPGGLVTAFEPVMRTHQRRLGRLARRAGRRARPVHRQRPAARPGPAVGAARSRSTTRASPTRRFGRSTTTSSPPRCTTGNGGTPTSRSTSASPTRPPRSPNTGAVVWVQDYQLQLVPQMLRTLRPDLRIGFFLHIPFPPTELFQQLPWRNQILEGLLGRRPGRVPAARWRAELRPAGPAAAQLRDPPRPDPHARRPQRRWPARTRSRSTAQSCTSWP